MNTTKKFRVCFQSKTGVKRGKPLDEAMARAWLDAMRIKYPELKHWLEEA